jgi:hypothetical protein
VDNLSFEQEIKLASIIAVLKGQQFKYSTTDCNSFVARCVDAQLETNTWNELIRGRYNTALGARRFQHKLNPDAYLKQMGYNVISADGGLQNGDIVLVDEKNFTCAHICYGGSLWSSDVKRGICVADEYELPDSARIYRLGV